MVQHIESSKLKVCSALAHMHSRGTSKDHKNFRFAAKAFLAASGNLADNFNITIAPQVHLILSAPMPFSPVLDRTSRSMEACALWPP